MAALAVLAVLPRKEQDFLCLGRVRQLAVSVAVSAALADSPPDSRGLLAPSVGRRERHPVTPT